MKIKLNKENRYLYPDIVISCKNEIFQDEKDNNNWEYSRFLLNNIDNEASNILIISKFKISIEDVYRKIDQ